MTDPPLASERGSRAALAGVVFASLFLLGWWLLGQSPPITSSNAELREYFADPDALRASRLAGLYVLPFAALAFIWFVAALRHRTTRAGGQEHVVFSVVQLIAGSMMVTAIFVVAAAEIAGVWAAEAVADDLVDIDSARIMIAFGAAMGQITLVRSSAIFIAISTTRARRAGLFPEWFSWLSLAVALALLVAASTWHLIALAIPAWVIGASIFILAERHNRAEATEA